MNFFCFVLFLQTQNFRLCFLPEEMFDDSIGGGGHHDKGKGKFDPQHVMLVPLGLLANASKTIDNTSLRTPASVITVGKDFCLILRLFVCLFVCVMCSCCCLPLVNSVRLFDGNK